MPTMANYPAIKLYVIDSATYLIKSNLPLSNNVAVSVYDVILCCLFNAGVRDPLSLNSSLLAFHRFSNKRKCS